MSIIKSIAIAALTVGIAGSAFAAKSQFNVPDAVRGLVNGDIQSVYQRASEEQRRLLIEYTAGFAGGLHARCEILNRGASTELGNYLSQVADQLEADKRAGRESSPATRAVVAGIQDGATLADGYGCRSEVGLGATRTVQRLLTRPDRSQGRMAFN